MNTITVLWSMVAGAILMLALVHALEWLSDRRALANLVFSIVAVAVACMAPIELRLMRATSPHEYSEWVRWFQLPIFVSIVGMVLFIRLEFGTGRPWLGWLIATLRSLVLIAGFLAPSSFNFAEIGSLERATFLGEDVTVIGQSTVGSWQWLAVVSNVLLALYVGDAAFALWRGGGRDAKLRAVIVGGGFLLFVLVSVGQTQSVIWGLARMPLIVSPQFLLALCAMSFELSRDLLDAAALARELRESEQRLELAAGAAGLGVWILDATSRSVNATDKARAIYGLPERGRVRLQQWLRAVHPDDAAGLRRQIRRAFKTGMDVVTEYRVRLPDGGLRWVAAHVRAHRGVDRKLTMVHGVLRDVTDERRARDETEQLRRELTHTGRVTMLGQLSAALAHELNQPLGAILRNVEAAEILLQSPTPDLDEIRAIVADIRKDDRRAGDVIERLRTLLRRRSVEFQPLRLEEVVQDVIGLSRADADARGVAIEYIATPRLPDVLADRVHLSQVLLNLLLNGMDAAGEALEAERLVVLSARPLGDETVEVAVTDSGHGVTPDAAARLFEPFFTTKADGMGMGLPISRTIVEAHGGRLWVESDGGHGATFRFTLRVAPGVAA